jgi:cytosine/uracil/thiamine/allantoin permease
MIVIKLTHSQFFSMLKAHEAIVIPDEPTVMGEKLVHVLMLEIYQKLYQKAILSKKEYSLKLSAPEAIAFWLYWQGQRFDCVHQANTINQVIAAIDRKVA